MKRKLVWIAILASVVLAALVYLTRAGHVPPGQRPLESLTPQNLAGLENSFNAAKDDVRLLLLLSPT